MIDYETFTEIHDCRDRQGLTIAQTARALGLDPRTVATWGARSRFEPRRSRPRGSVLDTFKPRITRLLDTHPYSAQQIFQRLREEGYRGGVTILRDYVRRIRPTKRPVYLKTLGGRIGVATNSAAPFAARPAVSSPPSGSS